LEIEVRPFGAKGRDDFFALHSTPPGECFCAYWWQEPGDDWSKLSAADNRLRREGLLSRGEYDGYLAYADGKVVGWCQVGPRDRLGHLRRRLKLEADPSVWAISCFYILPATRRRGVASALLAHAMQGMKAKGVTMVEAYPRRGPALGEDDMWNGPEAMLVRDGFQVVRDDPERPIMAKRLG
jgi:GNAT superfamily N-acetyltransferase